MRPVIYNDVLAAVSFAASIPPDGRKAAIARIIADAEAAARYRMRSGAAHPVFGDGCLMAAALRHGRRGSTSFACPDALDAWLCVLGALRARLDQPEAQEMQRVTAGSSASRAGVISSPQSSQ
ncbi:hypothetical protein [Marivita sp. GX14005]|uniref:DUF7742 family protein n=1 Tax=Marivita sp. GX14005 TaxID=2942276 RepID=UPI0020191A0E|nr:hypothetical protein [Marivita sp. GX14005]MCL3883721.1 hypothetical protein [Marivita sp. GX14005]